MTAPTDAELVIYYRTLLEAANKDRAGLEADARRYRELMTGWFFEEVGRRHRFEGQAPGHCHNIPGIWDSDNGKLAGKPCKRCALWSEIAAIAAAGLREGA